MLRSIFGTERPVQMKSLWPLAWACLQAILADSGTTWFSSARVPSISMNTSLLLVMLLSIFPNFLPLPVSFADSPPHQRGLIKGPSQLTLTTPSRG